MPTPRPHANCYWIVPDRLLAGEYPGAKDPETARRKLQGMLDAGIDCFVDLTHPAELTPYGPLLREIAAGRTVRYIRHTIPDEGVPRSRKEMAQILDTIDGALEEGLRVYVHCWGGVGRTGTVAGCYLARHEVDGGTALERLAALWRGVEKSWRRPRVPETEAQAQFVRTWSEPRFAVRRALRRLAIGEPVAWGALRMVPLLAVDGEDSPYLTLEEAVATGALRITEVGEGGMVPQLSAINSGLAPVLLLDGEELVGAKQNRIVNLSILVPATTELAIPVSCVEAGRWSYASETFRSGERAMFAAGRARKMSDVTASLSRGGGRHTDQGRVWEDVGQALDRLGATSDTGAMSAAFERHADRVEASVQALPAQQGQVGAAFFVGHRLAGLELFHSQRTLRASLPKLVRSYALDALGQEASGGRADHAAAVAELLERIGSCAHTHYRAVGLGDDVRFEEAGLTGAALVAEGRVVHLSAFSHS